MNMQKALFAAGCFWGVQYYFDQIPGVLRTIVGYTGGHTKNPTYDDVATRSTGHVEVTFVEFDPGKVSYEILLKHFFRLHDPTELQYQGPDNGDAYRSTIFYFDEEQHNVAIQVRNATQRALDTRIVTEITPAGPFYKAEEYHQKFSEKTGIGVGLVPYEPL